MKQISQSHPPLEPPAKSRSGVRWFVRIGLGVLWLLVAEGFTRGVRSKTLDYALTYNLRVLGERAADAVEASVKVAWEAYIVAICTIFVLLVLMTVWTPKRRFVSAIRFSLWPVLLMASFIGMPVALWLEDIPGPSPLSFEGALPGLILCWVVLSPVFVPLGYWLCDSPVPSTPAPGLARAE